MIELIPASSWGKSLRHILPRTQWAQIRASARLALGAQCSICGSTANLDCHEHWSFDDELKVQHLQRVEMLCRTCHLVSHFGRASQLASEGRVDWEALVQHFLKVNACKRQDFERHLAHAQAAFEERSKHDWNIDFGEFNEMAFEALVASGQLISATVIEERPRSPAERSNSRPRATGRPAKNKV